MGEWREEGRESGGREEWGSRGREEWGSGGREEGRKGWGEKEGKERGRVDIVYNTTKLSHEALLIQILKWHNIQLLLQTGSAEQ